MKTRKFLDLPFIGRSDELAVLNIKLEQALEYNGTCVLVNGDPGIGKTALVNVFLNRTGNDVLSIRTKIDAAQRQARDLIIQIIRSYLDQTDLASRTIPRVIDYEILTEFSDSIPELSTYLPYEPAQHQPDRRNTSVKAMFTRLINGFSRLSPLVLVVEDVHESNQDLLDMLGNILTHLSTLPVLMLLTADSAQIVTNWSEQNKQKPFEAITMRTLSQDDVAELNTVLFDNDLNPEFFLWLHERTQGVPLFVKEFLRTLFEKGVLFFNSEQNCWDIIETYQDITIPETISGFLQERLRGLTYQEIALLKFAAICGIDFDPGIFMPRTKHNTLMTLERQGIIVRKGTIYTFSHPLIRELIYQSIDTTERLNLHNELAHILLKQGDSEQAVDHFIKTNKKDTALIDMLVEVSDCLRHRGDIVRSVTYLEKAFSIAQCIGRKPNKRLANVMYLYACALTETGKYDESIGIANKTLNLIARKYTLLSKGRCAKLYKILSQGYVRTGKYKDAIAASNKGIRLLGKSSGNKARETIIELLTYKAFAFKYQWQEDKALKLALRIKKEFGKRATPSTRFTIHHLLGSIYSLRGQYKKAVGFRETALAAAKESGNESSIAAAHGNLGTSYASIGKFRQGMLHLLKHQQYSIEAGRKREEVISYYNLCCNYFDQGYLDQAEHECLKGIKASTTHNLETDRIWLLRAYAHIHLLKDNFVEAEKYFKQGIHLARKSSVTYSLYFLNVNKGILLFALNDQKRLKEHIVTMKSEFKDKFMAEPAYFILTGLHSIMKRNIESGIRSVKKGISMIEQAQAHIAVMKLLYILIIQFNKYKLSVHHIRYFMDKAIGIAEHYNMPNWKDMLYAQSNCMRTKPLRILCFGKLQIEHPAKGIIKTEHWRWAKPRQLCALFITAHINGQTLSRDSIGAVMWPTLTAEKLTNNFHVCLSQLKKVIGKEYIVYENGRYSLDNVILDTSEFSETFEHATQLLHSGKIHMAEKTLLHALELYTGDFLLDFFETWVEEIRTRYADQHRKMLLMLGEIYMKKLLFDRAITIGKDILRSDPFDEEGHRMLMRSYAASGRKVMAINQYKRCAEFLKAELQFTPSRETQRLYSEIVKM